MCVCVYIYMYICIERERERERHIYIQGTHLRSAVCDDFALVVVGLCALIVWVCLLDYVWIMRGLRNSAGGTLQT